MSCKVGNQTNSQDPQAVNSRVFVGNLNTFQCSKTDVERIFQRYGRIAGISMHKGYAFIQFTNPFDARSACLGEDGRLLWGQTLDVNMVAEPKAHQTGRKRQNVAKTGNDWDYYYDSLKLQLESLYRSYYAQVGFPGPRLVPPMKRARLHVPPNPPNKQSVAKAPQPPKSHPACNNNSLGDLKTYSTPDILICGNCRELFSEVEQLLEHKKTYCKLRFTCKCHTISGKQPGEEPAALLCSQCKDSFHSAWDLMVHVQAAHMLNIYQLSVDPNSTPKDHSEGGKDGESGGSSSNGTPMERGSPNGFNANGTLISDNLMEDSHCQTDLSLSSLPNHRPEISGPILESRGAMGCSVSTGTSSISTSTSTNENGQLYNTRDGVGSLSEMISLRNSSQGQKGEVNVCDAITSAPLINGNGVCVGPGGVILLGSGCNNNNNNNNPTFTSISSTSGGIGQVNSHSISPTFYSQPMEASTQTSNSDSLPPPTTTLSNGPSVNSSSASTTTGSFSEELCGIASSIKTETSVHLPLVNGQVAGI